MTCSFNLPSLLSPFLLSPFLLLFPLFNQNLQLSTSSCHAICLLRIYWLHEVLELALKELYFLASMLRPPWSLQTSLEYSKAIWNLQGSSLSVFVFQTNFSFLTSKAIFRKTSENWSNRVKDFMEVYSSFLCLHSCLP